MVPFGVRKQQGRKGLSPPPPWCSGPHSEWHSPLLLFTHKMHAEDLLRAHPAFKSTLSMYNAFVSIPLLQSQPHLSLHTGGTF